jgi:ketosteroid isomerase-like protein
MKQPESTAELRETIAAHANAIEAGDAAGAEKFADGGAIDAYRQAAAEIARLVKPVEVEALALAKVGAQYISKLKIVGADRHRRVLYRWRKEADGKWLIAGVEDTTNKRSPWSDVPDLGAAVAQVREENGNA